jgi:hypothetical protein
MSLRFFLLNLSISLVEIILSLIFKVFFENQLNILVNFYSLFYHENILLFTHITLSFFQFQ